jgi:hypothetical protein
MSNEPQVFREEEASEAEVPWCRVEFTLTEEEIRQGLRSQKLYPKLTRNVIETVLLVLVGGGYMADWWIKGEPLEMLEILLPILCVGLLFARWGMPWVFLWKNAKDGAGKKLRLSFFEKKLRVTTAEDAWWVKITPATEVTETDGCFLLSLPSQQMLLLPKRCFTVQELSSVREFLFPARNE